MIRVQPTNPGDPNTEVFVGKLRRRDAEEISRRIPGSWVDKIVADK